VKKALITGITGQDGANLAELLLARGYVVHGLKRISSLFNTDRIDYLYQDTHEDNVKLKLHYGDLSDSGNLIRIVQEFGLFLSLKELIDFYRLKKDYYPIKNTDCSHVHRLGCYLHLRINIKGLQS